MNPKKYEHWFIRAFRTLLRDRWGRVCFAVVSFYGLIALCVSLKLIANDWDVLYTDMREGISERFLFGTNINGQDVLSRCIYSTKTAFQVGIIVAVFATFLGATLGAIAGFFSGRFVDELILWLCGCLDSIPFYLFVAAIAFAMGENPWAMHIAMIATFWTGTARYVRAEAMRIKGYEFIEAARAIGLSSKRILSRHIIPNTIPIILVQSSIIFVTAIKSEVILSFLGLGVKEGVSWGLMIAESTQEISSGIFNNFLSASGFMFVLVMAFNGFSDALQDAFDPKHLGNRS